MAPLRPSPAQRDLGHTRPQGSLRAAPCAKQGDTPQGPRRTSDLMLDAQLDGAQLARIPPTPKDSKAEMLPEALVAHPSFCRMKTETQREDWSSEDSEPPSIRHTSSRSSCLRFYQPLTEAKNHCGKGVPWFPVGASRITCLEERDVGMDPKVTGLLGRRYFMTAFVYLSQNLFLWLAKCRREQDSSLKKR